MGGGYGFLIQMDVNDVFIYGGVTWSNMFLKFVLKDCKQICGDYLEITRISFCLYVLSFVEIDGEKLAVVFCFFI